MPWLKRKWYPEGRGKHFKWRRVALFLPMLRSSEAIMEKMAYMYKHVLSN